MSPLALVVVAVVVVLAVIGSLPMDVMPQSPIGETMRKGWRPNPRTVVTPDPDGAA
jgi:hypothetical protein